MGRNMLIRTQQVDSILGGSHSSVVNLSGISRQYPWRLFRIHSTSCLGYTKSWTWSRGSLAQLVRALP